VSLFVETKNLQDFLKKIYNILLEYYGPQGWWPIYGLRKKAGFDDLGYHPGNYDVPKEGKAVFQVVVGAILTQNTSWRNVQTALAALEGARATDPESILEIPTEELADLIRASGYYNQKARKLKTVTRFLLEKGYLSPPRPPGREELLSLWGIGPETADSILLYGFGQPQFVVDAYTFRLLFRIGICPKREKYDKVSLYFKTTFKDMEISCWNECHALIVVHSKKFCRKNPLCNGCPLFKHCAFVIGGIYTDEGYQTNP